jgi:hypothetical protein
MMDFLESTKAWRAARRMIRQAADQVRKKGSPKLAFDVSISEGHRRKEIAPRKSSANRPQDGE